MNVEGGVLSQKRKNTQKEEEEDKVFSSCEDKERAFEPLQEEFQVYIEKKEGETQKTHALEGDRVVILDSKGRPLFGGKVQSVTF